MPKNLVRYQHTSDQHFVTFSCHHRLPYRVSPAARGIFEQSLETMRVRYRFFITGYVVMPEHVYLLISEPNTVPLAKALQALKLSVTAQHTERPFWQRRYYDFNVFSEKKRIEKLRHLHRNPVARGLVGSPEEWHWSSFRHWLTGEIGTVEIESLWTASLRAEAETHISNARCGAPHFSQSGEHGS